MKRISEIFRKLGIFGRDARFHRELEEEMAFHREQKENELREGGMTTEDARSAARREFGNDLKLREESRDVFGLWWESTVQDFRFAVRQLRKNVGFTLTAIAVLTLGMAAAIAIFAFVDGALLKPLPYRDTARLVGVFEAIEIFPQSNLSYPDYLDWKKRNTVFSSLDAYTGHDVILKTPTESEPVHTGRVTDGFFRTLGVSPILGRDFYEGEDLPSSPRAAILTYATWQKRYGGRTDIVGQSVTFDDEPATIIGVAPKGFHFAPAEPVDFWVTLHPEGGCDLRRSCHGLYGVARLKDGLTFAEALADVKSIAAQLEKEYPDSNRGQGAALSTLTEVIVGDVRPILLVLLAGAGLLLVIATINVASLVLVRSETRRREIAVRSALGASMSRLIRQFVTEGLLLVLTATALSLALASWTMQLLVRLIPADMVASMAFLQDLGLHPRVLVFAAAISALAAILFSLTPALRLAHPEMRQDLAEGSRGSAGTVWRRMGTKLVVLELTTAMVLLVGAGLLGKSLYKLLHVDIGMRADHLATLEVQAPPKPYGDGDPAIALSRRTLTDIAALPGVESVGLTSLLPVSTWGNTSWFRIIGKPWHGEHNEVPQRDATPDYFKTLGAKLVRGRYFREDEDGTKPFVVIINQALAKQYFPGEDAVGQQIIFLQDKSKPMEIVGIVEDIKEGPLDTTNRAAMYTPLNQDPGNYFMIVARTAGNENALLPAMVEVMRKIDPGIATTSPISMDDRINHSFSTYLHRSSAWLVGGFAFLALLLSVVGLYGVIAYSVSQRTREIGVRIALGAQTRAVYSMILREAGWLAFAGIGAGLICAVAAATLMRKLLFGTQSWDVPTLVVVATVLAVAALAASYIPARRAASVDPVEALRME
ncbi:MAG TPA: ABC transporter permease [Candidatus Acidoferrales bacterium]